MKFYGPNLIQVEIKDNSAIVQRNQDQAPFDYALNNGKLLSGKELSEIQWEWLISIEAKVKANLS